MNFSDYLKQLRQEKNISQRKLAQLSGVSPCEISRIESGKRKKYSINILMAIASALEENYITFLNLIEMDNDQNLLHGDSNYITAFNNTNIKQKADKNTMLNILAPKLFEEGWMLGYTPRDLSKSALADVVATKDNLFWYIELQTYSSNHRGIELKAQQLALDIFGKIALFNQTNISKFSIAFNNIKLFQIFESIKPIHLNIDFSIIFVDSLNSIFNEIYTVKNFPHNP